MIQASVKNKDLYSGIRAFADTLASPHPISDPEQSSLTVTELKERRRYGLRRFSDEGLADLLTYTMALRSRTNCGLYDEKDRIKKGDDSIEDSIINRIYNFPEVQAKQQFIDSLTHHRHSLSLMTLKHLDLTEPYYEIQVGFNSEMRFETYYIFYVYKKDLLIKFYDTVDGEVISLDEWRKRNKSNINSLKN